MSTTSPPLKVYIPCLLLLSILALAFYWPTLGAGFVTDYTGLIEKLDTQGAAGIWRSYGFPAIQPLLNLGYYTLYKLSGSAGAGWFWVFILLHLSNAVVLGLLVKRLVDAFGYPYSRLAAGLTALVFLLSPYQTEVVVWKVCLNYLMCTLLTLAGLHAALSWFMEGKRKYLLLSWSALALAMLFFEQSLVVGPITLVLGVLLGAGTDLQKRRIVWVVAGQVVIVLLYFLVQRLWLGHWVGHYGAAVHLRFSLQDSLAAWWRYAFKYLFFSRYWPPELKMGLNQLLGTAFAAFTLLPLVFVALFLVRRQGGRLLVFAALAFAISLIPVLNLHFNDLLYIDNDRYGYLASAFFAMALGSLATSRRRYIVWSVVMVYLLISGYLLWRTTHYWQQANRVYWALLADFPKENLGDILVLNLPDNLQGAPLFRSYSRPDRALADALRYVARRPYPDTIHTAAYYNLTAPEDGIVVTALAPDTLQVKFLQWGNWWWRGGIGATDYETDYYIFDKQELEYRLVLKKEATTFPILYQYGPGWGRFHHRH